MLYFKDWIVVQEYLRTTLLIIIILKSIILEMQSKTYKSLETQSLKNWTYRGKAFMHKFIPYYKTIFKTLRINKCIIYCRQNISS